jgi:PAS domain S-box-containing protein
VMNHGYYNFSYTPLFDQERKVYAILDIAVEVTGQVLARKELEESEAKFRSLIEEAPVPTCLFLGRDLIIEVANQPMIDVWGKGNTVLGQPLARALPELVGQPFLQVIDEVFTTGRMHATKAGRADLVVNGILSTFYFDYTFKALRNAAGEIYAVMEMAVDVTEQVLSQQALQESDRFSRTIFYNSPVAKLVYTGPEMILREANEKMLAIFGRDASIIGKPIMEAIPELKQTQLLEKYQRVLATGEIHVEGAERIELIKRGESYWGYYDYTYKPLLDTTGKPYGVICTVIEVTEQVLARQKLEEAESGLRVAVEMAQLGTWSIDVATNGLTFSDRLIEWFGYDPQAKDYTEVIPILEPADQQRIDQAVAWALNPESDGVYNETYAVIHPKTGQKRILHAHGKTVFGASGKAIRLNGTAQDITLQRELQLALEAQVQQRTEELASANEELEASNEELEETNGLLMRSNDNLQQFAYVASHDLQEPLRKIQQFSDLLKNRYAAQLGDGTDFLDRMQSAATRMSMLIKDLLTLSRISSGQDRNEPIFLTQVLNIALTDLELIIEESGAVIRIDPLPTIQGDPVQLGQLFQNLLSNALKFRRPGMTPQIQVRSRIVAAADLPATVRPARSTANYTCISISDNGIGFDEKYVDRIFQVFQRLHGKSEFAGTGIGLAICEKVAVNHGGAISATSQPGQGSTFSVYLPM